MAHPLESMIREAYAAFGRGDVDGYLTACTPEFTFNIPGEALSPARFVVQLGCMIWPPRR